MVNMTPRFGRGQFSIVEEVGRDPLRPYAEVVDNRTKERLEQMAGLGIQIGQQAVRYDVLLEYTGELV